MIKEEWFKTYRDLPEFTQVFQSWDTANKTSELSDHSVCTTWGVDKHKNLYLRHVMRKRLDYPDLKRAVLSQAHHFGVTKILIEDKASGTQLIQDLIRDGLHGVTRYEPKMDKVMRMHSVSSTIENGFVYLPEKADWLPAYLHEMCVFPKGKSDDQVDSTSQALDWVCNRKSICVALAEYYEEILEKAHHAPPRAHSERSFYSLGAYLPGPN